MRITGTVKYQDIGMGFWGIIGANGEKWLPVNLPEHLKKEGKNVYLKVKEVKDGVSMFMWGTMVEII